jgi:tetratricopeptide (TPR) repeat protein
LVGGAAGLLLALALAGPAQSQTAEAEAMGPFPAAPQAWRDLADPVGSAVAAAFEAPGPLEVRVRRVRRAALAYGMRHLEAAARAVLLDDSLGPALARARVAVELAPELPDAHVALARALWSESLAAGSALAALRAGVIAVPGHLEGSVWLRGNALTVASRAVSTGAVLFLLVAAGGLLVAPARQLAQRADALPLPSAVAAVLAALLLPAAMGEGLAGLALAAAAVVLVFGGRSERVAAAGALLLLVLGLGPLASFAGSEIATLGADPAAEASYRAERGPAGPLERARLDVAREDDVTVARALALRARRSGDFAAADARLAPFVATPQAPASLLHNAANLRAALGRDDEAITLYERAAASDPSPITLFHLARAYGHAIRLDEHEAALARAQALDGAAIDDLTVLMADAPPRVALDLPVEVDALRARLRAAAGGERVAAGLRREIAPGALGEGALGLAVACAAVTLSALAATRFLPVASAAAPGGYYAGVAELLQDRSSRDSSLRMARLAELRLQQRRLDRLALAASLALPGAAGLVARRPLLGLLGALLFAAATTAFAGRGGVVPDPLAAGALGGLLLTAAAALAGAAYLAVTALAVALRGRG